MVHIGAVAGVTVAGVTVAGVSVAGVTAAAGAAAGSQFYRLPRGAHFPLELVDRVLTPSAQPLVVLTVP
jgi:hypothetical protein